MESKERTDTRLQDNIRKHQEFYEMFCRTGSPGVKLCTLYGDERLCPVRCDYAINRARKDLTREARVRK